MTTLTGYLVSLDVGADGLGTEDQIDSSLGGSAVFTQHDMPVGTGSVTFPEQGTVSGSFYVQDGQAYFVPDDPSFDPGDSLGYIASFTEDIDGTRASDTITGTDDADVIHDTDGDIYGGTGDDRITAGGGDDTIVFGDGNDTISGGEGNDQIGLWTTGSGDNTLDGGAGNDVIIGGGGNDQISGGTGDDTMYGAGGDDTFIGGEGSDQVWVTDNQNNAVIDGGDDASGWDLVGFSSSDNTNGVDVTFTGDKSGTYDFQGTDGSGSFDGIEHIAGTSNGDTIDATNVTTFQTLEGFGGDDSIIGGSGDSYIYGGDGNDTIDGGDGSDNIYGGSGNDELSGGSGNDNFYIDTSDDVTNVDGEGWWDEVYFDAENTNAGVNVTYTGDNAGSYTLGDASGTFANVEMLNTTSNDDYIDASASIGGELASLRSGNDTFIGSSGDDEVWAGTGDDSIEGGAGNDELVGEEGNDILDGGTGDDTIYGDEGDDTITGGSGNDELHGGDGSDTFVLENDGGFDKIADFQIGGEEFDQLDVSELHNADGQPVTVNDVVVSDDGYGNAVLSFPNGEGVRLMGIDHEILDKPMLNAMGIPCFTTGAMITTPNGTVPIEHLRVGDKVQTLDHGPQPIVWIGKRHLTQADLLAFPKLRPVFIREGALGNTRDMLVSPQHGMMTTQDGDTPQLARAIHLARNGGPGFRIAQGVREVTYYHLMFERHEVIIADGAPSESFYPGPMAMGALGTAEQREIAHLFPSLLTEMGAATYGPTARRFLKRRDLSRDTAALFEPKRAFA